LATESLFTSTKGIYVFEGKKGLYVFEGTKDIYVFEGNSRKGFKRTMKML
jgi:hypothetical protein